MPSKSKTKGNKFERDIRDFLNETYETEEFSRTPNSGAIMGRSNWGKNQGLSEDVKRTLGSDIITADDFKFAVECKHYSDKPNYATIIKGSDSFLDHWLGEVIFDAINLELHPLLFFKTNRKGIHFALPDYFTLNASHYLVYGSFIISGIDVFSENAEYIKKEALRGNMLDRTSWYETTEVRRLLENLSV
jgi:hypothetical protein